MPPSLSITNILQALYENSQTIQLYVDCIASGRPAPYTLITKSTEHEANEKIVERAVAKKIELEKQIEVCREDGVQDMLEIVNEILDEAMILEEEEYVIIMFKGDAIVEGSRQTVRAEKVEGLKDYARFKGYTISIKKHDTV